MYIIYFIYPWCIPIISHESDSINPSESLLPKRQVCQASQTSEAPLDAMQESGVGLSKSTGTITIPLCGGKVLEFVSLSCKNPGLITTWLENPLVINGGFNGIIYRGGLWIHRDGWLFQRDGHTAGGSGENDILCVKQAGIVWCSEEGHGAHMGVI